MCTVCSSKSYGEEYYKYYVDIFENLMRKSSDMISDIVTSWLNDCWSQDTWSQCQEVCVCLHLHILLTTRPHIQTLLQRWLLRIAQAVGSETRVVTTSTWHWNTNSLVPALHPGTPDGPIVPLIPIMSHFTSQHIPWMPKHCQPTWLVHATSKSLPSNIVPIACGPFQVERHSELLPCLKPPYCT